MRKQYVIYLRKSRKDIEAERSGAGETLARHEKELLSLAKKLKLPIGAIYREIVSGETIADRPEMQKLIGEVASGKWAGVLVMEVERLARGDTKDQGIVAEAFKLGNAKIVTPSKTYDPENEFDEEYFEFGLFMSRREYKTINRRIQRGRIASLQEGKWIASEAPYGYERIKIVNGKGYTLQVVPEEAKIVKLIYHLYTVGSENLQGVYEQLGSYRIANYLNSLGIPTRKGVLWSSSSIRDILTNPAYTGMVRWQWRKEVKKYDDGVISISRAKQDDCMVIPGLHEAIVSDSVYELAQTFRKDNTHVAVKAGATLQNPLAGLIFCEKCGALMTRLGPNSRNKYDTLKCPNRECDNISAPVELIEQGVIAALEAWVSNYEMSWSEDPGDTDQVLLDSQLSAINNLKHQIEQLTSQLNKTFDLLEQGIYTTEIFTERNRSLTEQIDSAVSRRVRLEKEYDLQCQRNAAKNEFIPLIKNVLSMYYTLPTAAAKNNLLKLALEKATYLKTERNKRSTGHRPNFELSIYPKIPEKGKAADL